ncbi:thioredoxin-related transmembrane protein 1-like [Rhopilema esculentum]|uniref:thioredoxin-related transmembrane protein 1-like n=1 Tax=Rhopilema esculentum TaxID=499914 RepID=UPI0031D2E498
MLPDLFKIFCISLFATVSKASVLEKNNFVLTDKNWTAMLQDEWLVKFYAPWCPACRSLESTWDLLVDWSKDRGLKFGGVDVTTESGLSGRFVITSLPTLYHVKDGQFRQYVGSRALEEFQEFITKEKWKDIEPVSEWKSPNSFIMSAISRLFGMSMELKNLHTSITETYGIPVWASFVLFGIFVVALGLILGLVMVLVSDYLFGPPCPPSYPNMDDAGISASAKESLAEMQDDSIGEEDLDSDREASEPTEAKEEGSPESNVRQRKILSGDE